MEDLKHVNTEFILNNSKPRKVKISCVYFLINRYDEIVYIGETDCFQERMKFHNKNKKLVYTKYFLLQMDCNRKERQDIERFYIKKHKPIYNFRDNPLYDNNKNYHFRMFFKHCKGFKQISDITGVSQPTVKSILLDIGSHKKQNIELVKNTVIDIKKGRI